MELPVDVLTDSSLTARVNPNWRESESLKLTNRWPAQLSQQEHSQHLMQSQQFLQQSQQSSQHPLAEPAPEVEAL